MKSYTNYIISIILFIICIHLYFHYKYRINDGGIEQKSVYIHDYTNFYENLYKNVCTSKNTLNIYTKDIDTNNIVNYIYDGNSYFTDSSTLLNQTNEYIYSLSDNDFSKYNTLKKYTTFTSLSTSGVSDYPVTLRYGFFQIEQPDSVYKFLITNTQRNLQYVSSVLFKDSILYMSNTPVMTDKNNIKIYYNTDSVTESRSNLMFLDSASFLGTGTKTNALRPIVIYLDGGIIFAEDEKYIPNRNNLYWDNSNKRLGLINVSPKQTLDVNGVLRLRAKTSVSNKQGGELYFNQNTNSFYAVRTNGTEYLIAAPPAPGANYMVGYNFYLGINTYSPAYTLEVNGRLFTDTMSYTTLVSPSDSRLKKNIKKYENALEKVEKIDVVNFEWTIPKQNRLHKSLNGRKSQGIIAQQVHEIEKNIVHLQADTFMNVDYTKFVPLLIKANQELNEKNTEQTQTLDSLQQVLNNLYNELKLLKK